MEALPIRAARRGDVPSLLLLWAAMMEENAHLDPRLRLHPDAREHRSRALSGWLDDPAHVVLLAEEGRVPVGYAAGHVVGGDGLRGPARVGEVTDCFVAPARRRRGIARRLAGRLFDLLEERGAEAVRLQVAARNAGSIAFWTSLGCEPVEEILDRPVDALPATSR